MTYISGMAITSVQDRMVLYSIEEVNGIVNIQLTLIKSLLCFLCLSLLKRLRFLSIIIFLIYFVLLRLK
jgi:hypothetical protein